MRVFAGNEMTMLRVFAAAAACAAVAAGMGAVAAAPASAQPDDPFAYQNPGEQILQGVIDSLLGNRYTVTDRRAVCRCSDAALARRSTSSGRGAATGGTAATGAITRCVSPR